MLDDFCSYVNTHLPELAEAVSVVAVSGGVDSMILLDLFDRAGYRFVVAHVDHHTRDGASTRDADWLEGYCKRNNYQFYRADYRHGAGNFQLEARRFRYAFFQEILEKTDAKHICTAHHADDLVETYLLMMARGAGVRGLTSMQVRNGNRAKPLLFATKDRINNYQSERDIHYRYDESNTNNAYQRNVVRHQVLLALADWQSDIGKQLIRSHGVLSSERQLLEHFTNKWRQQHVTIELNRKVIDRRALMEVAEPVALLLWLLSEMTWTADQCNNMLSASTGSTFSSVEYECLVDRDRLLFRKKVPLSQPPASSLLPDDTLDFPHGRIINTSQHELEVRSRQAGDQVTTTGGSKSLKRLLIDYKINQWDKADVRVVAQTGTERVYPIWPISLREACLPPEGIDVVVDSY